MEIRSLFEREDRYKTIVNLAPDIVYTLSKDGLIKSLSSSFERITGWKVEEWIGKHFSEIVYPEDLADAARNIKHTLKSNEINHFEVRIFSRDGKVLDFDVSITRDIINGKVVGLIGIARDVTIHRQKEKEYLHYANIVKSADEAIISLDLQGRISTWNRAAELFFGYKKEEVINKDFSILVPPDKLAEFKRTERMVKKGILIEDYETERVTKSGKRIQILAKKSPIKDQKGNIVGVSLFIRDITEVIEERKKEKFIAKASQILVSSLDYETTLKKIAEIMVPDIADWSSVHIINAKGDLENLTVAHIDPKKKRLARSLQSRYKYTLKDPQNVTLRVVKTGKAELYQEITDELIRRTVKSKKERGLIEKLGLRSAIIAPLLSGKKCLGAITLVSANPEKLYDGEDLKFVEDLGRRAGQVVHNAMLYTEAHEEIKKRKKIEKELRHSRDELDVVLKNIADGITVQDSSGKLIFANDAITLASGYRSADEMIKDPTRWAKNFELLNEDGEEFPFGKIPGRRALRGEIAPSEVINFRSKITGEDKWSVVKARPVFDEMGRVTSVVNVINDITERKELERRKDDFISIASHELRTPLTSIKGFIHLLKKDHESQDYSSYQNHSKYLGKVDAQIDRLADLIQDLLDLSRIQSGKLTYNIQEFKVSDLIHEVIEDIQKISDKHRILLKNGVNSRIAGDKERISQVMINLLTNAMKYSPESDKVRVFLKEESNRVIVGVKDYGIGISKDEVKKIFDRFYRVKDKNDKTYPGLGIGLYISSQIVARHRGKIWVESEKGQGSTFYFSLPTKVSSKE